MNIFYNVFSQSVRNASALYIIWIIFVIAGSWKMFEKAGKPGFGAIIPIYNVYCLFDLAWGNGWLMLTMLIPIVNIVTGIMVLVKAARAFGKGSFFQLATVFFSSITFMIMGFDNSQYLGPQ